MIQVAVFVSPQTVCSSLSQTCDAFSLANRLAGQRLFALHRFSVDGQPVALDYAQIQVDGDLASADQNGGTRIDHFTRASISDGVRPACASTALVSSPSAATLGPLCSGEPEKRKGGAGDL